MNAVKICKAGPANHESLDNFVDSTTTYVCLPDCASCCLECQVKEPGELIIESDGDVLQKSIDAHNHSCSIDLRKLFVQRQLRQPFLAFRQQGLPTNDHSGKQRDLRVTIKRGWGENAKVVATYNFQLLAPDAYQQAHARYLQQSPGNPRPAYQRQVLIVDWPAKEHSHCWNCNEKLEAGAEKCQRCGSEQESEPSIKA